MKKTILTSATFIFILASHAQSVREKIETLNREMEKSFVQNDMLKVSSIYADSANISSGSGRMNVSGRKAIDRYWLSLKDRGVSWKLEIDLIEDFGVYVLQRGRSYLKSKGSDGKTRDSDTRFFIVWIKSGDSYKILSDIYTGL